MKTRKPDMSRKAWEMYRKENLGGLSHNSAGLDYETWKDNKMNEYCAKLDRSTPTSEASHTPTPWTVGVYDASEDFKAINTHVAVCKPDGALLATCGPVDSESKADAAFIVRAVNAHEELVQALKQLRDGIDDDLPAAEMAQLCTMADHAIAKATGGK